MKYCSLKLLCKISFNDCEFNEIVFVLINQHQFDFINNDYQIVNKKFQITFENSIYVFNAKCSNNVEMQNFIDDVFAKTIALKLQSNFVKILNFCLMKEFLFIDKSVSNFEMFF